MSQEQEPHECPHCEQEIPNDIWRDPGVKSALKAGRSAEDIMVLGCPKCGRYGYYNQGSSFWCRFCDEGFQCLSEGEESDGSPHLYLDGMDEPRTLADTVTDTTDGYYNETRRHESASTGRPDSGPAVQTGSERVDQGETRIAPIPPC